MSFERAPERYRIKKGSKRIVSVDLSGYLDSGELVSSLDVPTSLPEGLAITERQVNEAPLIISLVSVPAGRAVQFSVDTADAEPGEYKITWWFYTNSNPVQKSSADVILTVYV